MTVVGEQKEWPLTGRGAELAAAVATTRRTRRPAGIVVAGRAGVGATRLARETLGAVRGPTRWVAGSRSAQSVPWGALAPLLGHEPSSITAAVTALAGPGGVVGVDDAHLLDDATAAAVRHVALLGRAAVVLTIRSGGPAPDAVTALWKDGTLPRIDLAPLTPDAALALVEVALGGSVDALTASRLYALTKGNPQLLRQVVEDELVVGRLRAAEGVWRWRGRFSPSPRLFELVAARADGFRPPAGRPASRRTLACQAPLSLADGPGPEWTPTAGGAAGHQALDGPTPRRVAATGGSDRAASRERSLRAAVARLDADAVERNIRHAPEWADVGWARMWAAGVRGVEPVDRLARAVHRAAVLGRPDEADQLPLASSSVGAALAVVNGRQPARDHEDVWGALAAALTAALAGTPAAAAVERGLAAAELAVETAWLHEDFQGVAVLAQRLAGELNVAQEPVIEPDLGPSAAATRAVTAGLLALDRGEVATAVRWLRATAVGPDEPWVGWCGWAAQRTTGLAQALAMAGDPAAARAALATLTVVPGWLSPQRVVADAWVAMAEGASTEALRHALHAADLAAAAGQTAVEVVARHTAVRFGDRTSACRLADLARVIDTPRAAVAAAHAAAWACDDGTALDAVAARWAELGAVALAADAAAQAALTYRAQGARGSAMAAGARADQWAARCDGLRTPALLAAARPLPLTDREREMTMLASTGLSNRAIADRLCVSVRTVEGHLYRACAKLAVPNRSALAAVLTGAAGA